MSQPQRPALKLKFSSSLKSDIPKSNEDAAAAAPPPSASTPGSAGTPKLTLKFGRTSVSGASPATNTPKSSTPRKPSLKISASSSTGKGSHSEGPPKKKVATGPKKLKLTSKSTTASKGGAPLLKIRARGRPPPRPLGVGYDSEASDREDDPVITDNFIFRFPPVPDGGADDCEYVRTAIKERRFGIGGSSANIRLRFLTKDTRRAVFSVEGRHYAAILVDLPCIVEAMKSWERKNWWKSGDVSQMLLVLGRCKDDEEALTYPLPKRKGDLNEKTWQWAHGLTPPLRYVRKRRFRKRLSVRAVEEDERMVERLLEADEECVPGTSKIKLFDSVEDYDREQSMFQDGDEDEEDGDAEGEEDTGMDSFVAGMDEEDDIFAAEMEKAMAEHAEEASVLPETPSQVGHDPLASSATAPSPSPAKVLADTSSAPASVPQSPAVASLQPSTSPQTHSGEGPSEEDDADDADDADDDDEDDEDSDEAPDEDEKERQHEFQRQREEIEDLQAAIAREKDALMRTANAILRSKIARKIEGLEGDLEVRKRALGIGDDDE